MAITWSSWRSYAGNQFRMGVDLTFSPSVPVPSTTSVTVTAKLYLQSEYGSNGGSDSWWLTSSPAGISDSNVGGWSWTTSSMQQLLVATSTDTVTLSQTATKPYAVTGRGKDLAASSLDISVTKSVTIPKRPVSLPAAPSGLGASRVSDVRQNLAWSNNPTSTAPYSGVEVRRDTFRNGAWEGWAVIAALPGSATSYADTSTVSPRRYRYAVRSTNATGDSDWHYGTGGSNEVATTPDAPTGTPSAAKDAAGDIVVTRPAISTAANAWDVQDSEDGVTWSTVASGVSAGLTSWVHVSPSPVVTHRYRVRARADYQSSSLWGGYSPASNTVQLLAAPLAPTGLSPSVADATEAITLEWSHNPVDTTEQTASQVRYRAAGSADPWVTMTVQSTSAQQRVLPADFWANGANREWQVATKGQHAVWSPWSTTRVTVLNNRPVVGVLIPGATHNSDRLTVSWSFHDPEATVQSRSQVVLLDAGGTVVETRNSFGSSGSVQLRTALPDGTSWTVEVTAWDGTGLASPVASQAFTVDWASPPAPTGTVLWHKDEGYCTVTVDAPAPSGAEVAVDHLQVWRANGTGWVLVADGLSLGQSVTDMVPPTGGVAVYRVAAVSGLPSTAWSSDIAVETTTRWVFLNFGAGFGQVVRVWGNLVASRTAGRERTLHRFAGQDFPVERAGVARTREYSLTARLFAAYLPPDMTSTWEDLEELADAPAPVLLRDPLGVRMFCSVGDLGLSDHLKALPSVSIPLTRVAWAEDEGVEL